MYRTSASRNVPELTAETCRANTSTSEVGTVTIRFMTSLIDAIDSVLVEP